MRSELASRHFDAFGSTCELLGVGLTQGALARCEQRVREEEARFTPYLEGSELARLNRSRGCATPLSSAMALLLDAAEWAFSASGGVVNVIRRTPEPGSAPPPALDEVLALDRQALTARLAPGVTIAPSAIVRGMVADLVIDELGGNGVCNLGGVVRVRGDGPTGDGWHVGLCDLTAVALTDAGVATCGSPVLRGTRGLPLGRPSLSPHCEGVAAAVSVVTESALRSEVYARCAIAVGEQDAESFLRSCGALHVATTRAAAAAATL